MAVSKRLRFEIFRRDGYTCRYCGRAAPEVKLVPDHIVPTALGGRDEPTNLVTSCEDCNSGKSATPPDAPLVAQVADDAARWAAAQSAVASRMAQELMRNAELHARFDTAWKTAGDAPRPADWARSVDGFLAAGLPIEVLLDAAKSATSNRKVMPSAAFRYMCGIAWARVNSMREEVAAQVLGATGAPLQVGARKSTGDASFAALLFGYLDEFDVNRATKYVRRDAEQEGEPTPEGEELTKRVVEWAFTDHHYRLDICWNLLNDLMNAIPVPMFNAAYDKAAEELGPDSDPVEMYLRTAIRVIAKLTKAKISYDGD